jgi:hypothetical protein
MNELKQALEALCQELGLEIPVPDERGRFEIQVGDLTLRLAPWNTSEVVLEGIIGSIGSGAESRWESQQDLLRQVLTWNIARLKGQARPEVLSFDAEENVLLLWRTWPADHQLIQSVLKGAEEMLNELEFWQGRLRSASADFSAKGGAS